MATRRAFLRQLVRVTGVLAAPSLLAACAPAAPAAPSTQAPAAKPAETKPAETKPAETKPAAPAATTAPAAPAAAKPADAPKPTEAAKPAAAAPAASTGGQTINFVWGSSEFPVRMNPQYTTAVPTTMMYDNFYDTLTRRDPDLKLLTGLATEWKLLNDTTWQFKLRPNVKWHNGDPFTAADVKFTVERTKDPEAKTIHATVFKVVKQIDIVDDLTMNVITSSPDALLPGRFAHYGGYLMPAKYFAAVGPDEFEKKPIGTGPFKFVELVKDDHLTLEANPDYWGGPPNVSGLLMKPMPEAATRIAALQKGDVQFIDRVPDDQMAALEAGPNTQTFSVPFAGVSFIVLNTTSGPLTQKALRQAMSLGIDRQSLSNDLYLGRWQLVTGPIPNGEFGSKPGATPPPYDQKKARDLVAQAGYKGEEIAFEVLPGDKALAEAITAMWKDVGVDAKIQIIEPSVRSQKIANQGFTGAFTAAFVSTLSDPSGLLWRSLGPGGVLAPYWTNDEWIKLGNEADSILDQEMRRANYERMADIMMEEIPWLVLFQPAQNFAALKSVQWRPHPNYMLNLRNDNLAITQ
jgi:peptide/nickel transport system substrate-binding protein